MLSRHSNYISNWSNPSTAKLVFISQVRKSSNDSRFSSYVRHGIAFTPFQLETSRKCCPNTRLSIDIATIIPTLTHTHEIIEFSTNYKKFKIKFLTKSKKKKILRAQFMKYPNDKNVCRLQRQFILKFLSLSSPPASSQALVSPFFHLHYSKYAEYTSYDRESWACT